VARGVTTEEIAATWIESRVRTDVGAPLLAARMIAAPPPEGGASPGATAPAADAMLGTAAPPTRDPLSIAVAIESSFAGDGTDWRTYSLSACARIGPVCVGALGRLGDNEASVHDDMFIIAKRSSRDLLVTASLPIRGRRFTLSPMVGAGVGWMRTSQRDEPLFTPVEPGACAEDPTISPEYCELPDRVDVTTRGARLAAGVSLSIPLGDRVALDIGVSGELLTGAHTDLYVRDDPWGDESVPCEPEDPSPDCAPDGTMTDPGYPDDFFEYPGEPDRFFRAGIGLRIGLP
jgi:hypothetical protein